MRKYDSSLVDMLQHHSHCKKEGGVPVVEKPIPETEERFRMDPRVLEAAKEKYKRLNRKFDLKTFQLDQERIRPDRVTCDLTTAPVEERQILIPIAHRYINACLFSPANRSDHAPVVLYLHGGGFIAGSVQYYRNQCRLLAQESGAVVVFPEYRLAPENPYPAGVDDCFGVLRWIQQSGGLPGTRSDQIILAGDSAGGGLANSCILKGAGPAVKLLIEIYPCSDMDIISNGKYPWDYSMYPVAENEKKYAYARIDRIRAGGEAACEFYLHGQMKADDPRVSINYGSDLSCFPMTLLIEAEYDFFKVSNNIFAQKCAGAQVPVDIIRYLGCDHGFLDQFGTFPQAEDCILEMAKAVRSCS